PLIDMKGRSALRHLVPDLLERDEPAGLGIRERFEQDAVDDREGGGRGADRDGEREDDGQRKAAVTPQRAYGVAQIEEAPAHAPLDGRDELEVYRHTQAPG